MTNEQLILVSPDDHPIGVEEKLLVHQRGLLHRAFSVFLFNDNDELLLQRRALHKYHSAGLWSNTCCGHPRPGEDVAAGASRRLTEELGISCPIAHVGTFTYSVTFDDGLIENEIDHVFVGHYHGEIEPNPNEVAEIKWEAPGEIESWLKSAPSTFTHWFSIAFEKFGFGQPHRLFDTDSRKNGASIEQS